MRHSQENETTSSIGNLLTEEMSLYEKDYVYYDIESSTEEVENDTASVIGSGSAGLVVVLGRDIQNRISHSR